jgi:hypothetical protein
VASKGQRALRRDLAIVATAQSRCSGSNVSALARAARAPLVSVGEAGPAPWRRETAASRWCSVQHHGSTSPFRSVQLSRRRRRPTEREAPVPPRVLALCSTLPVPCRPRYNLKERWVGWAQRCRWWRGGACIILLRPAADNSVRAPRGECGGSEGGALTRVLPGRWHLLLHTVRLRHPRAGHHGLDGGVR